MAAQAVDQANAALRRASLAAADPTAKRRDRRAAARSLDALGDALDVATRHWQQVGQPAADRLTDAIAETRQDLDDLRLEALRERLTTTLNPNSPTVEDLTPADRLRQRIDQIQNRSPAQDLGLGL